MALPNLPFAIYTASKQLISGNHINNVNNLLTSFTGNLTALAGGALAGATPLNSAFCELTVVANANDSAILPPAKVGLRICVMNSGAASAQIFANGTDTINGTAGATGVALANGATALYVCTKNGVWRRFISA